MIIGRIKDSLLCFIWEELRLNALLFALLGDLNESKLTWSLLFGFL